MAALQINATPDGPRLHASPGALAPALKQGLESTGPIVIMTARLAPERLAHLLAQSLGAPGGADRATPRHKGTAWAGFGRAPPGRPLCHWSPYIRHGVFPLYRARLRQPDNLPLLQLRATLPKRCDPRWSRIWPTGWAAPDGAIARAQTPH